MHVRPVSLTLQCHICNIWIYALCGGKNHGWGKHLTEPPTSTFELATYQCQQLLRFGTISTTLTWSYREENSVKQPAIMSFLELVPWQTLATLAFVYLASLVFYRLFLHPLARFPGPKLAAITRYYEGYHDVVRNGQYTFRIAEMHKQYGTTHFLNRHRDQKF